jgi:D-alanine-D-alanine ligase
MINQNKILICYNEPTSIYDNYIGKDYFTDEENVDLSESEFLKDISLIKHTLLKKYESVDTFSFDHDISQSIKKISQYAPDIIFNFVEAVDGNADFESFAVGALDILGISYTGNTSLCLGNCLNKLRTKQILQSHKINTPRYYVTKYNEYVEESKFQLKFPVILKLVQEDASIGISEYSVVKDFDFLLNRLNFLYKNYKKDVLIEEYIIGRELNVSILDNEILPISEITFANLPEDLPKIVTYEAKWSPKSLYYKNTIPKCPALLDDDTLSRVKEIAIETYNAMDCRDYARVDLRLSNRNIPYVIEVNPNPDISTDSGYVRSAKHAGISYQELIYKLANQALSRINRDTKITEE